MSLDSPVVLVHGMTASTDWWRPTIAALEPHHDVRIVELRGLPVREAAQRLAKWLESEDLHGAALVGHSMGGTVAVETAARAPEAVGRLVLIAPAGIFPSRSRRSYTLPLARSTLMRAPTQLPRMVRDTVRVGPLRLWHMSSDLLRGDITPALRAVRAPSLVVWGANDRLLPPALGEEFRTLIPDCRLVVLPKCGHIPMLECPDALHEHLLGFLA
jgi:2-hydroxy-6-oxonona-2,4-dienedioate hydrolase